MNPQPDIPDEYWALSACVQTYLWAQLITLGVDLVGISEFMDYPAMIPGATLIDWDTGEPNARYRALAELLDHFVPGDTLVATTVGESARLDSRVHAQGFVGPDGTRKLLIINKDCRSHRDHPGDGLRPNHHRSLRHVCDTACHVRGAVGVGQQLSPPFRPPEQLERQQHQVDAGRDRVAP
jgi:hypothetical protein